MINSNDPKYYRRIKLWKDVSPEDWNSRSWQLKNLVTDVDTLSKVVDLSPGERSDIEKTLKQSKLQLTPYYISLIDDKNPECPIRLQAIPKIEELDTCAGDLLDPLAEDADSPVPRLVHRYPDRVLFLVSEVCSMYCRFCTRRRHILDKSSKQLQVEHDKAIAYIKEHSEVRDVILSGGDALMLPVEMLERIVAQLKKIPHVEIIRVASRMPCVFPMGVTKEYVEMLSKYQPIFFMTHFNHPYEATVQAVEACDRILSAGIPIHNQSVLLRKINSDPRIIKKLMHELLKMRVHPYYIYQCDLAEGIEHFRTPVSKSFEIMEYLRGHTSGLALPTFVIDAPGGGGKIPIMPNYLLTLTDDRAVMRNYRGLMSSYTNPRERDCSCSTAEKIAAGLKSEQGKNLGYIELVDGKRVTLKPQI
ncbi:MAG TPA: KamA family radical SAM protein [bacterium]|nr:KamA family radical SAM protein [Myxococcales bacterium]HPW45195.1 KamA family radical SAM protein [bacterium]HQG13339.1 KamA family radical SAM protein [bacterium]HQH80162.1 KamA family radical SAM protein [bacterium]